MQNSTDIKYRPFGPFAIKLEDKSNGQQYVPRTINRLGRKRKRVNGPIYKNYDESIKNSNKENLTSWINKLIFEFSEDLSEHGTCRNTENFNNTRMHGVDDHISQATQPISSLCNLGNTCYLNSVLYTLRFTPGFLHNLHHMIIHLGLSINSSNNNKKKRASPINGTEYGNGDETEGTVNEVIGQLHELFRCLSTAETTTTADRVSCEPLAPSRFLSAVGRLNPAFEGNQQQDAHELLVVLLNMFQDIRISYSSQLVGERTNSVAANHHGSSLDLHVSERKVGKKKGKASFLSGGSSYANSGCFHHAHLKSHRRRYDDGDNKHNGNGLLNGNSEINRLPTPPPPPSLPNFVRENFMGKSVMRTRCLECETSTYRSESFTYLDVPLLFEADELETDHLADTQRCEIKDFFKKQVTAAETLRENNKYWCEECSRLNEAQRTIEFEVLPKLMVLQLKRFATNGHNTSFMSKIIDYIPTPFTLSCFCRTCSSSKTASHLYTLYAVIMHLGSTLTSGHYVSYVKSSNTQHDVHNCCWSHDEHDNNSMLRDVRVKNPKRVGGGIMKYFIRNNHMVDSGSTTVVMPPPTLAPMSSVACNGFDFCCSLKPFKTEEFCWLQCDDENVKSITQSQFEDILSCKAGSAATPYLLFYRRL